jgi:hypothetical protein
MAAPTVSLVELPPEKHALVDAADALDCAAGEVEMMRTLFTSIAALVKAGAGAELLTGMATTGSFLASMSSNGLDSAQETARRAVREVAP